MEKAHVQYQDLLKESCAATLPTTLKVTSGSDGFRVMDPFDWTMDKNVYQRWQLWSHKARLTLEAMEGDTEKTKISYLYHWLNGEGISKIEGWKNSKILISQSDYDELENTTSKYSARCFSLQRADSPLVMLGSFHLLIMPGSSCSRW